MKYLYWLIGLIVLGGIGVGSYYLGRSSGGTGDIIRPTNTESSGNPSIINGMDMPDMSGINLFGNNVSMPTPNAPVVTPTPTPSATTKTYTSRTYGFSFKYPTEVAVFDDFLWPSLKKVDWEPHYLTGGSVTLSSQHDTSGMPLDAPTGPNDVYMQISIWKVGTDSITKFLSNVGWDSSSFIQTDKQVGDYSGALIGKKFAPTPADAAAGASTYIFVNPGEYIFRIEYQGNSTKIQAILDSLYFPSS